MFRALGCCGVLTKWHSIRCAHLLRDFYKFLCPIKTSPLTSIWIINCSINSLNPSQKETTEGDFEPGIKMKFIILLVVVLMVSACFAKPADDSESSATKDSSKGQTTRIKRGYGHGGGGGGGGHGGGYGHGPGAGGGARGPVYFCGWVGSKEGSGGYGGYGK